MKSILNRFFIIASLACIATISSAQNPSKYATDVPADLFEDLDMIRYDSLIGPACESARKELPKVKEAFEKMIDGQGIFIFTRIYDQEAIFKNVRIKITKWDNGLISGTLEDYLTDINYYQQGMEIELPESAVLDWVIIAPNGKINGNYVATYLKNYERNH
ncbi:MAG: DUF2314 domain-containing protein [Flavobacteriales bacterium]|nr:DUF2314 domain-containing protein [Flavobacteriales bacterium]